MKKKQKKSQCKIGGCIRPVKVLKHQLCHAHAVQYYRHGVIIAAKLRKYDKHPTFSG